MPRKSLEEQIAQLDARRKALLARAARTARAAETRRKVLLGAWILHEIEHAPDPDGSKRRRMAESLDRFLTRQRDRDLFADLLPPSVAGAAGVHSGAATGAPAPRGGAEPASGATGGPSTALSARQGSADGVGAHRAAGTPSGSGIGTGAATGTEQASTGQT